MLASPENRWKIKSWKWRRFPKGTALSGEKGSPSDGSWATSTFPKGPQDEKPAGEPAEEQTLRGAAGECSVQKEKGGALKGGSR